MFVIMLSWFLYLNVCGVWLVLGLMDELMLVVGNVYVYGMNLNL